MRNRHLAAIAAMLVWPLTGGAWSAQLPPPSAATTIVPNGAVNPTTLGAIASGSRFLAQRSYLGLWKPFAGNLGSDGGGFYPTTKTAYMALEVPDDFTAVQLIFGNQANSSYTVADAAVSGSSQYGASSTFTPGVTPYDGSGNTLTSLSRATFANGGANSAVFPPSFGTNCLTTNATSAANQAVLTFAATTGVLVNQVAAVVSSALNYLSQQSYVVSTTSTAVTLSQNIVTGIPSGTQVCFLPIAATIPAAPLPPVQAIYRSDWIPVTSYPRIDSPVVTGGLVLGTGIPANTTASSSTPTSVTLSTPTTAAMPAGTKVNFCRATTVTNATAPVNTLNFASVPATIVPGMAASYVAGANYQLSQAEGFPSPITVTGTTSTTVSLSSPIGQTVGSGQTMLFYVPLTVASAVANGATSVTVNTVPSNIATGMYAFGTGIAGSSGPTLTPGTTISAISGATLTLSAATNGPLVAGATIYAAVTLATNAASSIPSFNVASTAGIYQGALLNGAGIAPNTYAVNPGGNYLSLSQGQTATLTAGQTLNACDPLVTSAAVPAGATILTFASTTYPGRLLLVRIDFGSTGVSYSSPSGSGVQALALSAGLLGMPRMDAGTCTATSSNGVLAPGNIGNSVGSCGRLTAFPIWAIKVQTARRGVVIANLGDSHFEGDTTTTNFANMTNVAGNTLSTPNLPVWTPNLAFGGQDSATFFGNSLPMIREVAASVVTVAGYTWNDIYTQAAYTNYMSEMGSVAGQIQGYGGLPVILTEYPRQVYGCNASNATNEALRLQARTSEMQFASSNNLPLLDVSTILTDPSHSGFIAPSFSTDCVHANDNGHGAAGAALANLLTSYVAN